MFNIKVLVLMAMMILYAKDSLSEEEKRGISKDEIPIIINNNFQINELYLPSINEIYRDIKAVGIANEIENLVQLKVKNYTAMQEPHRVFEVGKTLSDITLITLKDVEKVPSKALQELTFNALNSIPLPQEFRAKMQVLGEKRSELKGKELRTEIDQLIGLLSLMQKHTNQNIKDVTSLLLASAYFKAFYLGATVIKQYDNPTEEQLALFKWDELVNYFYKYFNDNASEIYKSNKKVIQFTRALEKIKVVVNKNSHEIDKNDVIIITNSFKYLFD